MTKAAEKSGSKKWPLYGWIGLCLLVFCWTLNWTLPGVRAHILFFPQWLGYCLCIDALTVSRTGASMVRRSRRDYVALFFISAPAWWLFELINLRTQNWHYVGRHLFSDLGYFIFASITFSTVMPSVFSTAELIHSFKWPGRMMQNYRVVLTGKIWIVLFGCGCMMMALLLLWPRYFFPMVWLSLFFIIEPVNHLVGGRTLLSRAANGEWSLLWALSIGCLICGFFWEMWNVLSYPKWIYAIPFVDCVRLFEMPLPGYLGYLFFPLELYALYHFFMRLLGWKGRESFILSSQ